MLSWRLLRPIGLAMTSMTLWNKLVCECFIQIHLLGDEIHIEQNILHVLPGLRIRITDALCLPFFDSSFENLLLDIGIEIIKVWNIGFANRKCFIRLCDCI